MIAEAISDLFSWASSSAAAIAPRSFRNASLENPAIGLSDPRLAQFWGGGGTASDSGITVSHRSALTLASVWGAVDMISGDVAKLPLDVYKRLPDDDREVALDHEAEFFISAEPNEEMCAFEFWKRAMVHALLWQNAYIWVSRQSGSRRGKLLGLYNLLPDRTKPVRLPNGDLAYQTEVDGQQEVLMAWEVDHIKGMCIDNEAACDLIAKARDAIGLALAAQGYNAKFFANGAQAAGTLTVPAGMSETAVQKLQQGMQARTGKDNWFKLMVLREGAAFHATTIDAQKSQTHELREDQVRDLARFFRMPPAKLGLEGSVSYNSAEMASLDYLGSCISQWSAAIIGSTQRVLLSEQERRTFSHYLAHNVSKLIEIDVKTMNEVLAIQRQNEIINANEWRRKIDLNARTDPGGKEYKNPNTKSAERDAAESGTPAPQQQLAGAQNVVTSMRGVLLEALGRATRRVSFDARQQSKKPAALLAWLDDGAVKHRSVFDECLRAPLVAWCAVCGGDAEPLLCDLSGRFFSAVLDSLSPLVEPPYTADGLVGHVDEACKALEQDLPARLVGQLTGEETCRSAA